MNTLMILRRTENSACLIMASLILILINVSCTGRSNYSTLFVSDENTCDEYLSGSGIITLDWEIPLENTDNSPLIDETALSGFIIYFGPTSAYGKTICKIVINNPLTNSYDIRNLKTDIEYGFAIAAYNTLLVESDYSNILVRTISTNSE